ncbi:hypothetical protein DFJ77DRAFT_126082 [Powellomyces hirtus]|nr:hypothetical protein DFJ77DRAFT_126082 [Powellomyces hirtus]
MQVSNTVAETITPGIWVYALELCVDALAHVPVVAKNERVLRALRASVVVLDTLKVPHAATAETENPTTDDTSIVIDLDISEKSDIVLDEEEEDEEESVRMKVDGTSSDEDEGLDEAQDTGDHIVKKPGETSLAGRLGDEILELILKNLSPHSYGMLALVNRQWNKTARRMLWTHPKFHYTGSLAGLFKFYACLSGQTQQFVNEDGSESNNALTRVRRLTLAFGHQCEEPQNALLSTLVARLPAALPLLTAFEAVHTSLPNDALVHLAKECPKLTSIDLFNVTGTAPASLVSFLELAGNRLVRLNLTGSGKILEHALATRTFGPLVSAFEKCTSLRTLCLGGTRIGPRHFVRLFTAIGTTGLLEKLDLTSTGVDDIAIETLVANCPRLATVLLSDCAHITDAAIKLIAEKSDELSSLAVTNTGISDSALRAVANARGPHLRRLAIGQCRNVTNLGLDLLGHFCTQLQILDISDCQRVTASGLLSLLWAHNVPSGSGYTKHITTPPRKYPSLKHLNLSTFNTLTSAAITHILDTCSELRTLLLPAIVRGRARAEVERRIPNYDQNHRAFFPQTWVRSTHSSVVVWPSYGQDGENEFE